MKLKSYVTDQSEQPKRKYQTKTKGYSEEGDFLYYNNFTDERELAEVTNFRYTQDSSDDSSY